MDDLIKELPTGSTPLWGGICLVVGLLLGRGVDALIKLLNHRLEARKSEQAMQLESQAVQDEKTLAGLNRLIDNLTTEIKECRQEIKEQRAETKEVQTQHIDCLKEQERMRGRDEQREAEVHLLRNEVEKLRQWRHDVADKAQTIVAKAAVDQMLPHGEVPPT